MSEFFTDDELEAQLREQFDPEQQWDTDFKQFFNQIEDRGEYLYLKLRGREFFIDPLTGFVQDLVESDMEEDL